jgi:L-histidine Nalpha-methyltransferase
MATDASQEDVMSRPEQRQSPPPDPDRADQDVLDGLRAARKHLLPSRLLYDARGAGLFEQICTVADYYPTRAELALLEDRLPAIAATVGALARVVEPGSGAGRKTRMLLTALDQPAHYIPIDISGEQLEINARALRVEFPGLDVQPVHGDYTRDLELPPARTPCGRTLVFFPGSTIGNFEPDDASAFLTRLGELAGPGARLLLGADANADPDSLLRAYNDSDGVTAAFDLNVLAHLNRTQAASFDLDAFIHRATWDRERSRIEMHLVSRCRQTVVVAGEAFAFERGEPIVTEHCYKYPAARMAALLAGAGWQVQHVFSDPDQRMHLWLAALGLA